ncbi:isopenicillin N synthase family dioxygenase [Leekyejoonella antrihumi]|uniref:Isopenicillin N synthase family oxygenase n=1 Tax=Leekyejoonella antrihumi TaxID=1660198 RepID=A0A563E292_9MICO|nr:2-oxoglutarate and iron-dependent oxygenase domain-containing protein [Leekyejoonella antrihumi]TWP36515.1 isopenicillin N synthase family oxygenase [Leekyejoonella antrihumi]
MPSHLESLPVLDLSQLDQGDQGADDFLRGLRRATHEIGFFYLVGHGVPQSVMDDVIGAAHELFALPEADKGAIAMTRSAHFRGFTRVGGERTQGTVDWREQIDIGPERAALPIRPGSPGWERLQGPNQWPAALPGLRAVVERWETSLAQVARRLLHAWARSLGQSETVFDSAFGDVPATLMKIVRYPGRAQQSAPQGVGAHKDSGVLTLLYVEPGKGGLQVEHDGEWIDAPAMPGAFVVNIGELLEYATGGYLRATVHRVVSPPEGSERISAPYFFNPALDSQMPILTLPNELAAQAVGVTQDPRNPIFATYGANALKSRLRAHPDVAAIHHADLVDRPA